MSEGEVMKIGGWRTRSVMERYNIIDESDLRETFAKVDKLRAAERELIALQEAQRVREAAQNSWKVGYKSPSEAQPN